MVSAWFKDGAALVEITATAINHDVWRNATTNTIDLDYSHQWEMIWLNANSDHDSGWRVPGIKNPGDFLGQVTSETGHPTDGRRRLVGLAGLGRRRFKRR